jgi:hypothetical protein
MNEALEKSHKNLTGAEQRWNNEGGHQPMGEKRQPVEGPSELETVISQTITFSDGSRIRIFFDVPPGANEAQAMEAYNNHILRSIQEIERTTSDSLL